MDHSTMNYEWKKITDAHIEGDFAKKDNRTAEVVKFKEYGNTCVVYMYEDNKYKGSRGYQGEKLAREMAIEYLETGKEL